MVIAGSEYGRRERETGVSGQDSSTTCPKLDPANTIYRAEFGESAFRREEGKGRKFSPFILVNKSLSLFIWHCLPPENRGVSSARKDIWQREEGGAKNEPPEREDGKGSYGTPIYFLLS